ncbi:MAG TPA: TlpA disulfide reductase family protein [Candidatus Binatia bacterium]|jgi:thiol-disulfide isomerase/thioredoxin
MKLGLIIALSLLLCVSGAPVRAQGKINYKQLVPNLEPMKDNSATPDFTLVDPSGKKVSLKEYRGKLVMLNFWATWCVPCREEMPAMERLYQQYKNKGFVILGVDVKDSKKDAFGFLKELKISYPIVLDPDGEVGLLYGAWGLPTTYLIGPKGEGLARLWGPAAWDGAGAKQLVQDLLDGKR